MTLPNCALVYQVRMANILRSAGVVSHARRGATVFNNGPGEWGHQRLGDRNKEFSPAHHVGRGAPSLIVFLGGG